MSKLLRRPTPRSLATLAAVVLFASSSELPTAFAQTPKQPSPQDQSAEGEAATEDEARRKEAESRRKADDDAHESAVEPKVEDEGEAPHAVFFAADVAFTRADLGMIVDELAFDETGANGTMYGVTGGYRTKNLRLGLRWRVYDTTEFDLWSFAVSVGYALPMRPLTPVISAHLGYVFDQRIERPLFKSSLPEGTIIPPNVDVKGVMLGLDVNAAYWVTSFLRFGPFLGADMMVLHRAKAPLAQSLFGPTPDFNALPLYSENGVSLGLNLNVGVRGSFDIGLR